MGDSVISIRTHFCILDEQFYEVYQQKCNFLHFKKLQKKLLREVADSFSFTLIEKVLNIEYNTSKISNIKLFKYFDTSINVLIVHFLHL